MKCIDFFADYSRCKRGMPVAPLFRHYFCEGNHARCPLKSMDETEKHREACRPQNLSRIKGGSMKCMHLIASRDISACSALETPYVPSLFELGEYCRTGDHRKCPFYLKGIICKVGGEGGTRQPSP